MNKGFVFGESYFLSVVFKQDRDALWWHMKQMPNIVSLHHIHHVWCACRSQEEFTDSNVLCRVTSRPKHFRFFCYSPTSSFVIFFILSSFVKCIYVCIYIYIYIYFPLPLPNLPVFTFFSYFGDFFWKVETLRVVLEIFWGRGLAKLVSSLQTRGPASILTGAMKDFSTVQFVARARPSCRRRRDLRGKIKHTMLVRYRHVLQRHSRMFDSNSKYWPKPTVFYQVTLPADSESGGVINIHLTVTNIELCQETLFFNEYRYC